MILASNFRSEKQGLHIDLQNLPWEIRVSVNSWRIDEQNEWIEEAVPAIDPKDPVLNLNLPSGTIVLLQLQAQLFDD